MNENPPTTPSLDPQPSYVAGRTEHLSLLPDFTPALSSGPTSPPWNGFDTFLRRGVMIAAFIVLWVSVAAGLTLVVGGAAVLSHLSDTSTSTTDVNTPAGDPAYPFPSCDPDLYAC